MEYQKLRKSVIDFGKDLIHKPIRTILICVVLIFIYLLRIIVPNYVTSIFTSPPKANNVILTTNLPEATTSPVSSINNSIIVQYVNDNGTNSLGEPYSVNISYPKFGIKILDDRIVELINAHIILAKYGDSDIQSHFTDSFEQPYIDSKVISLEISLSHFGNDEFMNQGRPFESTIGINYDRINNRIYSINDLPELTGLSLKKISTIVSGKLTTENNNEKIELSPTSENFSNFVINKNNVIFIFQRYQVLAGAAGTPRISVERI